MDVLEAPPLTEAAPVLKLCLVALKSVATVGACAAIGAYARLKGYTTKETASVVDKLNAGVFLPCLIMSKVVPHIDVVKLLHVWPMAVLLVLNVLFGLLVGVGIGRWEQPRYPEAFPKFTGLCQVAIAFPNSFTVPLTLILTLGDNPVLLAGDQPGGEELEGRIISQFLLASSRIIRYMCAYLYTCVH